MTELASASDRAVRRRAVADLAGFFQEELAPYLLSEVMVFYPAIDSVVGTNGYAVTAALLDAQMIASVASDLGPQTDIRMLEHHSHLLAALVGSYFDKECLLILPILGKYFSDKELQLLIDRLEAGRALLKK
ncbi:MAG: hypothetical protein HY700_21950 [Gemmatimonadetes bacterium]|nr:hypothetical protein [Gemmatimonadota bacterium]